MNSTISSIFISLNNIVIHIDYQIHIPHIETTFFIYAITSQNIIRIADIKDYRIFKQKEIYCDFWRFM